MAATPRAGRAFTHLFFANMRELTRDKVSFAFILVFPFMFLLVFLFINSSNAEKTYTIGISIPPDAAADVRALADQLATLPNFTLVRDTEAAQRTRIEAGTLHAALVLPAHFDSGSIRIIHNGDGVGESQTVRAIVAAATRPAGGPQIATEAIGTIKTVNMLHYSLPGILVMAFASLALFGTATPLIQLRQRGTLRLLGLSPLSPATFVAAQIAARFVLAMVQFAVMLSLLALILGKIPLQNLPGIIFSSVLGLLFLFGLGYILGELIPSPEAAGGVIGGLLAPVLMLTGVILPFDLLPEAMQTLGRAIPLTYLGDALRQQMIDGQPLVSLWLDNVIIGVAALVTVSVAVMLFRWGAAEPAAKLRPVIVA